MFNRPIVDNPPELAEPTEPAPVREKKPMREAECLKPSSFASRKAAAEEFNAMRAQPRIASLGMTSQWLRTSAARTCGSSASCSATSTSRCGSGSPFPATSA